MAVRPSLLDDPSLRGLDKPDQFGDVGGIGHGSAYLVQSLIGIQLGAQQQAKSALQGLHAFLGEAFALQAYFIDPETLGLPFGHHQRKWRHILGDDRGGTNVGVAAHAAKLVHRRGKSNRCEIFDGHVSRKRRSIYKQVVVANVAVVPNVRRGQKQILVADGCPSATLRGAATDRHVFAKRISLADDQFGVLAAKPKVLRIAANRAERMKHIVPPNLRRTLHNRVGVKHAAIPQLHPVADHRVRTNLHAGAQLRSRRDRCLQMDMRDAHAFDSSTFASVFVAALGFGSRSTILHINVASAASCPSTVARPSSLAKSPPRQESTLTSSFSWSPGTTGRRKRASSTATK